MIIGTLYLLSVKLLFVLHQFFRAVKYSLTSHVYGYGSRHKLVYRCMKLCCNNANKLKDY